METLKYRVRFTSSMDKGLHKALYNYSIDTGIPFSRLLDGALKDWFDRNGIAYQSETPYQRRKIK